MVADNEDTLTPYILLSDIIHQFESNLHIMYQSFLHSHGNHTLPTRYMSIFHLKNVTNDYLFSHNIALPMYEHTEVVRIVTFV